MAFGVISIFSNDLTSLLCSRRGWPPV